MAASLPQKLLLALGAAALGLVGAEALQRARTGWDRGEAEARLADLRDEALGHWGDARGEAKGEGDAPTGRAFGVAPYVGFDFEDAGTRLTRDLARQAASTGEEFRILVLGGSVAANFAFLGKERLFEALRADPRLAERELELFMYARPSYKQPQQLLFASVLFTAGLEPDLVLNLDGFNELAIGARNADLGVHPMQPTAGQWLPLLEGTRRPETLALTARAFAARERLVAEVDAALASPRLSSALLGPGLLARVQEQRAELARLSDALVAASAGDDVPSSVSGADVPPPAERLRTCVDLWAESSRSLAALCAGRGVPYVHALQPTLHDEGSKPLTEEERATSKGPAVWVAAARAGYPLLREAGARLRDEHGVAFLDASRAFAELREPVYYDVCHFQRPGHEVLAEAIAPALLAALR